MPQLDFLNYPYASQIFWLLLNFGILYFTLKTYVVPKISSAQGERNNLIQSALNEAKRLKQEAEKSKSGAEEIVHNARHDALSYYHKVEKQIAELKAAALKNIHDYSKDKEKEFTLEAEEEKNKNSAIIKASANEIAKFILEQKFALDVKESKLNNLKSN